MAKSPITITASKCRVIFDKHWYGGNRAKDPSLSAEAAMEIGICKLCTLPDSQQHMLCECTDHTTSKLRETVLTRLNQHVHRESVYLISGQIA